MKTTKLLILGVAATLLTLGVQAQDSRFSLGLELGLPMGSFGDGANFGFGGSLRYEMPMGDNLALMGTAGYVMFGGKEVTSGVPGFFEFTTKASYGLIPIQVGAKYYFTDQQEGFYAMAQLGLTLINSDVDITTDVLGTKTTTSASESSSGFSYAPGIGYHLANLDFGLSYQLFSQTVTESFTDPLTGAVTEVSGTSTGSYLGVRIAYVFGGN